MFDLLSDSSFRLDTRAKISIADSLRVVISNQEFFLIPAKTNKMFVPEGRGRGKEEAIYRVTRCNIRMDISIRRVISEPRS